VRLHSDIITCSVACDAQHLKNRRMRVDIAGQQQQQGKTFIGVQKFGFIN